MSPKLNLFIGVLAVLSLPALSACNTGGGGTAGNNENTQAAGEGRGTDWSARKASPARLRLAPLKRKT